MREILLDVDNTRRVSESAITAMQEASEMYLTGIFRGMQVIAINAKRVTVNKNDCTTALSLCANIKD